MVPAPVGGLLNLTLIRQRRARHAGL